MTIAQSVWANSLLGKRVTCSYRKIINETINSFSVGVKGTGIWCQTNSGQVFKSYPRELK